MNLRRCLLALLTLGALWAATPLAAASPPAWQWAPPLPPVPSPGGVPPSPTVDALGQVGDIEFWAPNRGLLITGGAGSVPAGVWAYDGVNWHELSDVCGGGGGRIAWAGPDEFWTIADQRPGQILPPGFDLIDISLCHFQNGQVVGSYAMPVGVPDSYLQMTAAACVGPNNCWFGGQTGTQPPTAVGAFHLHWDGQNVSVVYSPIDHSISAMAVVNEFRQPTLYETGTDAVTDLLATNEQVASPFVLDTIGTDTGLDGTPFHPVQPNEDASCTAFCTTLPDYGKNSSNQPVQPQEQAGLVLGSDVSGANPGGSHLWAVAGASTTTATPSTAHPIVMLNEGGAWSQVVPNLTTFPNVSDSPLGVAAIPGTDSAWMSIASADGQSHVALLSVTPGLTPSAVITEPDPLGPSQNVGDKGETGPITCPAANDCWLATSKGWLFHYTDGSALPQDADPNFAGVISFRPSDGGVPQLPLDIALNDDSLANQQPPPPPPPPPQNLYRTINKRYIVGLKSKLVHHTTLRLSFRLLTSAHIQLIAMRNHRIVARTTRLTLRKGLRIILLRLDPKHWPTKLKLDAKPLLPFTAKELVTGNPNENISSGPAENGSGSGESSKGSGGYKEPTGNGGGTTIG